MPEYRLDPLTGAWVIIARERVCRPSEFVNHPERRPVERCPFCGGNEQLTPPSIASYPHVTGSRDSGAHESWEVRVFSNKYPAVVSVPGGVAATTSRLHTSWPGHGLHEIVVESSGHSASFAELSESQALWSFVAYRDCLVRMADQPGLRYGLVFKNCRAGSGATLEHSHSQVLATALIPAAVQQELQAAERYRSQLGQCLFCDLVDQELASGTRVVAVSERYVVLCPYASRFPYETWLLPRRHADRFEAANLGELAELSRLFQSVLRGLEKMLAQPPYNFWIHTSPFDTCPYDHYHWHIELIPRLTIQAGFEWGSGCYVNPIAPEDAAAQLRGDGDLGE